MSESQPQKPKIIVDEDWKSQVQAEKEAAAHQHPGGAETPGQSQAAPSEPQAQKPTGRGEEQLPPPSFPMLITTLATQAMAALGQMPDESGKPMPIHLSLAKHFIDLLGMLEEKTQGNLTPQEKEMLGGILHELRVAFVAVQNHLAKLKEQGHPQ